MGIDFVCQIPVPLAYRKLARCCGRIVATCNGLQLALQKRICIGEHSRTRRTDTGQTDIVVECIGADGSEIFDVETGIRAVVESDLERGVTNYEVAAKDVPLRTRSDKDPVRIADDRVIFDGIILIGGTG